MELMDVGMIAWSHMHPRIECMSSYLGIDVLREWNAEPVIMSSTNHVLESSPRAWQLKLNIT